MKIAFFSDTYRPNIDGVVSAMHSLEVALQARGHAVEYFAPMPKKREDVHEGAHYAPSFEFPMYKAYRISYSTGKMEKEFADGKFDVLHSHAMATLAMSAKRAAKKTGKPLVGTFHTMLPDGVHYITSNPTLHAWGVKLTWDYLRWLYDGFDALTSPSAYVKKLLATQGIESVVVPGGIDTSKFRISSVPPVVLQKAHGEEKCARFLFVGRMVKEKNLDYIYALAKTGAMRKSGAKFYYVGEGPYKAELEARAAKDAVEGRLPSGLVNFEGRVKLDELVGFYNAADVFVFPSKFETQGLVALEALACGTPVFALEKTAAGEIIEEGKNGTLGHEGDGMEDVAERLLKIAGRKPKISSACRRSALAYDCKKTSEKVEKLYEKCIDEKEKAR